MIRSELKTLEWWISGLMLNPLFFLISRLNMACFPHEFNLQIIDRSGLRISHSKVFISGHIKNTGFFTLALTARGWYADRTVLFFFVELHLKSFLFTGSIATVSSLLFADCQIQGKLKNSII